MSTIFSDPGWRRGSTLLNNETIELDGAGAPIAGGELVGQVKVFQDINPSTGVRFSNRLVYCVAARYTGSTALTAADAGKAFAFSATAPLREFSAVATTTDVNTNGRTIGILDEYLSESVRTNDIVWLVVKGPTTISKATGSAVAAGAVVQVTGTAGAVTTRSTGTPVGQQIAGAEAASGATSVRINLYGDAVTGA
jgi:hypothetical protein